MTDLQNRPGVARKIPRAIVKKSGWHFPVVWVVPVIAALVAGYLIYDSVRDFGPTITIKFKDGNGLKAGKTAIQYRGVRIGDVKAVELSEDLQDVVVEARLKRAVASIAREGAIFWIVRLEGGIENITGLGTVIAGSHIEVLPGAGEPKSEFVGLEKPPVVLEGKELKLVLFSNRVGSLKLNTPVFYRGIEVGAVQALQLSADATSVDIHVFIKQRYAKLVRNGSKFWEVSGTDVKFGLFSGLEINMQSLKSLVAGGIAFATPDHPQAQVVKDGSAFRLYDAPQKEWLEWKPKMPNP